MIYRLAVTAGAQVEFGVTVTEVAPGKPRPSVTLADGEVIGADIVIGADGPKSLVRQVVSDGEEDEARPDGYCVYGGMVPAAYMKRDSELAKLITAQEVSRMPLDETLQDTMLIYDFSGSLALETTEASVVSTTVIRSVAMD
jgi:hypothetical protein